MAQKQTERAKSATKEDVTETEARALEADTDIEDVLDAIDAVLEENAEDFVAGYIQKGGQ